MRDGSGYIFHLVTLSLHPSMHTFSYGYPGHTVGHHTFLQKHNFTFSSTFVLQINVKRFAPARRCPTTSARLPFLTLVMKAPSLPVSVILPPTTYTYGEENEEEHHLFQFGKILFDFFVESIIVEDSMLAFRPRREPASRGMADLLLSVMRPIRWSPSLDGCHVTGCYRRRGLR